MVALAAFANVHYDRGSRSESPANSTVGRASATSMHQSCSGSEGRASKARSQASLAQTEEGADSFLAGRVTKRSTIQRIRSMSMSRSKGVLQIGKIRRSLQREIDDLMSFEDCEELLRATNLAVVLRRGSSIFSTADGNYETYSLSHVASDIDVFLSHNWGTPRTAKFLTLVYQFNYDIALFVMVLTSLLITLGSIFSVIPEVPDQTIVDAFDKSIAIGCKVASVPVFLTTILFARDFTHLIGRPGPSLFLDKCCIDQVDRECQQRGIRKLGAFLSKSRHMLVLYSDLYLRKLWTIYEMASFLGLHDLKDLKIVPVVQPRILFMILIFWSFYNVTIVLLRIWESFYHFMYFSAALAGFICMISLRGWSREKAAIAQRVTNFTVADSLCANEDDRPLVYNNIKILMQGSRLVSPDCDMAAALAAFDDLVRSKLPHAFGAMQGFRAFRFRDYVLIGFAADGVKALDWGATLWARGFPFRIIFPETLYHVFWMACWPLIVVLLEFVTSYNLALRGWYEKALVGCWVVVAVIILALANQISLFLMNNARESDPELYILLFLTIAIWATLVLCCRDRRPALSETGRNGGEEPRESHESAITSDSRTSRDSNRSSTASTNLEDSSIDPPRASPPLSPSPATWYDVLVEEPEAIDICLDLEEVGVSILRDVRYLRL